MKDDNLRAFLEREKSTMLEFGDLETAADYQRAIDLIDASQTVFDISFLPCGHHVSCGTKNIENGKVICEFCDTRSARNDAEKMEAEYRARAEAAERERDALRVKVEKLRKALTETLSVAERNETGDYSSRARAALEDSE